MDYPERRNVNQRINEGLISNEKGVNFKAGSTGGNEGNFEMDDKSSNRVRQNRRERNLDSRRHLGTGP